VIVREALAASRLELREARLLLSAAAAMSEASVVAFPEKELPFAAERLFFQFSDRRCRGEPIAYILGRKEFYGLALAVDPAVLIPRPETELLVDLALQRDFQSLLDLGTGCGAVALALKQLRPRARVVAIDSSAAALAVARRNAATHGFEIDLRQGRWFAPVAGERFDLVVANPPYVAAADPHLAALRFEPNEALVAGADGLEAIREIADAAPKHLHRGGWMLLEHGLEQQGRVSTLLRGAGLEDISTWPDLAGIARVTGGKVKS